VLSLPEFIVLPLNLIPELAPTVQMLFAEAFADHPGRQTAVDRLAEYFLVLLLRAAMNERLIEGGVLSGLGDPRLAKAIAAMHDEPERSWSLEQLAHLAGMSRARFAAHFRNVVGVTPFDYLTDWRIGITQTLLRKGEPPQAHCTCRGLHKCNGAHTHLHAEDKSESFRVTVPT
jgi:AraC-like DNA-binding protein